MPFLGKDGRMMIAPQIARDKNNRLSALLGNG
jgi:hypothetical protein